MAKRTPVKKHKKKILLSLSMVAPEPQYITIIDENEVSHDYPILLLDQLGVKEQARLGSMSSRAEDMRMTADITDQMLDDLIDIYRELVKAVMPELPQENLNDLPIQHLQAIIVVFTEASGIVIPDAENLEER